MTRNPIRSGDSELARAARAGSMEAFEELVYRYEKPLYGFLWNKAGEAAAEDLVQQVFIKAYRNIGRYNSRYPFKTWLYTIARREAASHYRATREPAAESNDDMLVDTNDPATLLADRERIEGLWRTAGRVLPESQFTTLWLVYHEGMSMKEAAKVMKRTVGGIKVLLHRGRKKLLETFQSASNHVDISEKLTEEKQCIVS